MLYAGPTQEHQMSESTQDHQPSFFRWAISLSAAVGITGMLCCVAPMVLFMFGFMGGVYAISFADFFYDGEAPGTGAWFLRFLALLIGVVGIWRYHKQQQQCSLEPQRQQINLILLVITVTTLGVGLFYTLEGLSSWYFNAYIVPAQQLEFKRFDKGKETGQTTPH